MVMKPFRKHVAIAIDGGGIRGIIPVKALAMLEEMLGKPAGEIFTLAAGTSTGSIISAGIGAGISAQQMYQLYVDLGPQIFANTLRKKIFPLTRYRYSAGPLMEALYTYFGDRCMGEFWTQENRIDVVITAYDLVDNHTRFIKPWKEEYAAWLVVDAVRASSTVPTFFPVFQGRYADGGVGAYANPSYLAAYEAQFILEWDPAETTLISMGTGREPYRFEQAEAERLWAWQWLKPVFGAFIQSADDQQLHLVDTFFKTIDFRRFQVDLPEPIDMDDISKLELLAEQGERMGRMIINDMTDPAQYILAKKPV
jgi:uncharacterized protein